MSELIEYVRLVGSERRVASTLEGISRHWQQGRESFLFVSPHDDDVAVGAGLLIQLARRENVLVHILIVTDGSMGYCTLNERQTISQIRRRETFQCYQILGVSTENIVWLGFPDCRLNEYRGRRPAQTDEKGTINGYTGLQNALTYYLRKTQPTQCFLPTSADLHPDHRIVHEEFLMSVFHAAGEIWPEMGTPLKKVPYIHEIAVYCNFPQQPQLRIRTGGSFLKKKLQAIAAFRSQKQVQSVIELIKAAGPEEYTRALEFKLYDPRRYRGLFDAKGTMGFVH